MNTIYEIETIKSGQPRPYADTEREYKITVKGERYGKKGLYPYLLYGNLDERIKKEESARAAGKMSGGLSPEELRKRQLDWAKKIVRALCQDFRERDDNDGRSGMEAAFYPTLEWIKLDQKAGIIHVFITEAYTG